MAEHKLCKAMKTSDFLSVLVNIAEHYVCLFLHFICCNIRLYCTLQCCGRSSSYRLLSDISTVTLPDLAQVSSHLKHLHARYCGLQPLKIQLQ